MYDFMINTRKEKYAPLRGLSYLAQGEGRIAAPKTLQKKKLDSCSKKHVCNKDTSQKNKFGNNSRHQPQNTEADLHSKH